MRKYNRLLKLKAGLLIGLLASVAYLSSAASGRNYPLGVTHGVLHTQLLITDNNLNHVYQKMPVSKEGKVQAATKPWTQAMSPKTSSVSPPCKKVSWWLIALVTSLVLGSWVSGRISAEARWLAKPPKQIMTALLGGTLRELLFWSRKDTPNDAR